MIIIIISLEQLKPPIFTPEKLISLYLNYNNVNLEFKHFEKKINEKS